MNKSLAPQPTKTKREEILQRDQMKNLIKSVDNRYEFDKSTINQAFKDIVEDFLDVSFNDIFSIAEHRGSDVMEIEDALFYYRTMWNLDICPSYSLPDKSKDITKKRFSPQQTFKQRATEFKEKSGINKTNRDM
ncbi:Transcription initiation factor TFIID subunit 12 domain-containing protein [Entamoeba marina]